MPGQTSPNLDDSQVLDSKAFVSTLSVGGVLGFWTMPFFPEGRRRGNDHEWAVEIIDGGIKIGMTLANSLATGLI